ncbi:MAG TPA: DUF1700 domain-containing protein [Clostridiaceae bacterium]|nr:DUF1700 domain-containing protein [Clostridiaceae bacterium]
MNERVADFINRLKKCLADLPPEEIGKAVSYYEEYLNDACDAGKDIDDILARMDPPEKIAEIIKMESNINHAQNNPGLRNFTRVLQNAFRGATRPVSILAVSIYAVISYSLVIMFFAGTFVTLLGAVVSSLTLVYHVFTIRYTAEMIGTIGIAVLCAGVFLLIALGLYLVGRLLVKLSSRTIRLIVKKPENPMPQLNKRASFNYIKAKKAAFAFIALSLAGLILSLVTGLPLKYFIIFNSMKPHNIVMRTESFESKDIKSIFVTTEHSNIRMLYHNDDDIIISYEQPDWLDYNLQRNGNTVNFVERSNGRLPLFELVKIHQSATEVTLLIPKGIELDTVVLESTGGYIYLENVVENVRVKTFTGNIFVQTSEENLKSETGNDFRDKAAVSISANTQAGYITVNGKQIERSSNQKSEYSNNLSAGKSADKLIELTSSRGNIRIN